MKTFFILLTVLCSMTLAHATPTQIAVPANQNAYGSAFNAAVIVTFQAAWSNPNQSETIPGVGSLAGGSTLTYTFLTQGALSSLSGVVAGPTDFTAVSNTTPSGSGDIGTFECVVGTITQTGYSSYYPPDVDYTITVPWEGPSTQLNVSFAVSNGSSESHSVQLIYNGVVVDTAGAAPRVSGTVPLTSSWNWTVNGVAAGATWSIAVDGVTYESGTVEFSGENGTVDNIVAGTDDIAGGTPTPTPAPTASPTPTPAPSATPYPTVSPTPTPGPTPTIPASSGISPTPVPAGTPPLNTGEPTPPPVDSGTSAMYNDFLNALDSAGNQNSGQGNFDTSAPADLTPQFQERGQIDQLQPALNNALDSGDSFISGFESEVSGLFNGQNLPISIGTVDSIDWGSYAIPGVGTVDLSISLTPYMTIITLVRLCILAVLYAWFVFATIDSFKHFIN